MSSISSFVNLTFCSSGFCRFDNNLVSKNISNYYYYKNLLFFDSDHPCELFNVCNLSCFHLLNDKVPVLRFGVVPKTQNLVIVYKTISNLPHKSVNELANIVICLNA